MSIGATNHPGRAELATHPTTHRVTSALTCTDAPRMGRLAYVVLSRLGRYLCSHHLIPKGLFRMYCQLLQATHDHNGNPRRVWVLYAQDGSVLLTEDQGYEGRAALTKWRTWLTNGGFESEIIELPTVDVTVKQYRTMADFRSTD
jgi:hypothetical protein